MPIDRTTMERKQIALDKIDENNSRTYETEILNQLKEIGILPESYGLAVHNTLHQGKKPQLTEDLSAVREGIEKVVGSYTT